MIDYHSITVEELEEVRKILAPLLDDDEKTLELARRLQNSHLGKLEKHLSVNFYTQVVSGEVPPLTALSSKLYVMAIAGIQVGMALQHLREHRESKGVVH